MPVPPDVALQEAVRAVLSQAFGDRATQTISTYINPIMAVNTPDEFLLALRRFVGPATPAVEARILGRFYQLLGLAQPQNPGMTFRDHVEDARRQYVRRLVGGAPGWA
ncbi:MAG: hypothetical protein ACRDHY_03745 [Anaerolineales bacterium]